MTVAAVILAAGASTRFGSPKQQARIGGRTLVERAVDTAREAGLDPIVVVLPPGIDAPSPAERAVNDDPAAGLSRSLRLGLAALGSDVDYAVILLADQPTLSVDTLHSILTEPDGRRPIVAASADRRLGPPVLVRRDAFGLADEVSGDLGLRTILDERPELVATVEIDAHAPDVDTHEDLERLGERCPGCRELYLPTEATATHQYIGSSPACWEMFSELLAREFADPAYGVVHRHTVDVYAVQHPGDDGRRQRQSVAVHLIGLCHWLEHGLSAAELNRMTQELASLNADWPWLTPPERYDMTVADVLHAGSGEAHVRLTREWAESVWGAWSRHQSTVRAWAKREVQRRIP